MKAARLAVLGISLTAGLGAAYVMMGSKEPAPEVRVVAGPPASTDAVLVATRDIIDAVVTPDDIRWQTWPKDQVPKGVIARSQQPNGLNSVKGMFVNGSFHAGELLRPDRLSESQGLLTIIRSGNASQTRTK